MKQDIQLRNGPTAAVFIGIVMVLASLAVAITWPHVGALSIVGLVWGSLLISIGLWFDHRNCQSVRFCKQLRTFAG